MPQKEIVKNIGNTQAVTDCNKCKTTQLGAKSVSEAREILEKRQSQNGCTDELTRCASLAALVDGTATINSLPGYMEKIAAEVKVDNFKDLISID